jgi:hypothetical protein
MGPRLGKLALSLGLLTGSAGILPGKDCTNADFAGLYGEVANGSIFLPPGTPITGPFGRMGWASADGKGGVTVNTTAAYNGLIFSGEFKGAYTVSKDCTWTFQAVVPPPINLPSSFTGVISQDGDRVDFALLNPPGTTISARLQRQKAKSCKATDLAGGYAVHYDGAIVGTNPLAGPVVSVGRIEFSSSDNALAILRQLPSTFVLSTQTSYGGMVQQESATGTYTVNRDCTMAFEYSHPSAGGPVNTVWRGFIANDNKEVFIIRAEPAGASLTGSLIRQ